jgi:hypothetical protein
MAMTGAGRWMPLSVAALAGALALVGLREIHPPSDDFVAGAPIPLIPTMTGQAEYCLTCHEGIEPISAAHPTEVFGCVVCHGGQPLALDAETAHAGLRGGGNPSSFDVVEASCGGADCHSGPAEDGLDHIHRSMVSLQSTYAGAIAVVREAFGAQTDSAAHFAVAAVVDPEVTSPSGIPSLASFLPISTSEPPSVQAFGDRCLRCHLQAEPIDEPGFQRLSGCAACHSPTNWQGTYTGNDPTIPRTESGHAAAHTLTTSIPFTQCNTCHNRGNYSLVDMTFHERADLAAGGASERLIAYYQPIAQFTSCEQELDCIDCHPSGEVMGDGDLHRAMSDVRSLACRTCHGTLHDPVDARTILDASDPALRQAQLNPHATLEVGDKVVVTDRGDALWNVQEGSDGTVQLMSKVNGTVYAVPQVAGSACEQSPDEQESSDCHACHAVDRP